MMQKFKLVMVLLALFLIVTMLACASREPVSTIAPSPTGDGVSVLIERARRLNNAGDTPAAIKTLDEAIAIDPSNVEALHLSAVFHANSGNTALALSRWLLVMSMDPSRTRIYYNIGALYANKGEHYNPEKAAYFFQQYLHMDASAPEKHSIERWLEDHRFQISQPAQVTQESKQLPSKPPSVAPSPSPASQRRAEDVDPKNRKDWLLEELRNYGGKDF